MSLLKDIIQIEYLEVRSYKTRILSNKKQAISDKTSDKIKVLRGKRMRVEVGDKVYVPEHKRPFKVKARDDRYIICTKPYNPQHTVIYFIVDLVDKWRAPDNMIFCSGYETDEECQERLKELQDGIIELSIRRGIPLDIDIE